ncbi:unnamed protein product, partial [Heterosigma akashiwo]
RSKSTFSEGAVACSERIPGVWEKLHCSGDMPGERSGHQVVTVGNKAYLLGGCGGSGANGKCKSDFYCFNYESRTWTKLRTPGQHISPNARASFEMIEGVQPNTLLLAGGTGDDGLASDIWEYHTLSRTWRRLLAPGDPGHEHVSFYGQTMNCYNGGVIFFGGSSGHEYTNNLCFLNLKTLKISNVDTTGEIPTARYKHQSIVIGDHLWVFGGGAYRPKTERVDVHTCNLKTHVWKKVDCLGDFPEARVAHTCQYDEVSGLVYMFGGFTKALERLGDFYSFDVRTHHWSRVEHPPLLHRGVSKQHHQNAPVSRAFHACCLHYGSLYVFGGADGETRFADVWKFAIQVSPPKLVVLAAVTV